MTLDTTDQTQFSQEVRLVSTTEGPVSWLVGAFYSQQRSDDTSSEFTPGFSQFWFDNYFSAAPRPDDLEYYNVGFQDLIEQGLFGELGFDLTDRWNVTVGARYYTYNLRTEGATTFPILRTALGAYGPDEVILPALIPANQRDEGTLWKFNTSFDFTDDIMGYFTYSEGFRIGNTNGLNPCTPGGGQSVCASPGEEEYNADVTENFEIGFRTEWMDGRLILNLATYYIDWVGPQVTSASLVGSQPIIINGEGASTRGYEINFNWEATERFTVRGAYSYTDSQLSALSRDLITVLNQENGFVVPNDGSVLDPESPFFGLTPGDPASAFRIDGQKGDRLPGAPQHSGSLFFNYNLPLENGLEWDFSYGVSAISEVLTRTGGRGGSLVLPSYSISNISAALSGDNWGLKFYVNNLFDEFAEIGAVGSPLSNNVFTDDAGGPVYTRGYYSDVLPPRTIGVRVNYEFGD